jgi:tetratricopeptide (TPR) repeat protein
MFFPDAYCSKDCQVTYTCTCAHVRAHTHAQMSHHRSPSPIHTLSLCCCQIKVWKAGHKGECTATARADTRTAVKQSADQMRVLKILLQLDRSDDWRGVAAQEREARSVAATVQTSMPLISCVYYTLGCVRSGPGEQIKDIIINTYVKIGNFSKDIEYHAQDLSIAKEVGDRSGEGRAYWNLGNAYRTMGDFSRAIECHTQHLTIAKVLTLAAGVGRRGARTRNAVAAVWRGFAAQIIKRWLRTKPYWAGVCGRDSTRISAECSASGARLSKTVWRLTRALRTWWRFCSDECTP